MLTIGGAAPVPTEQQLAPGMERRCDQVRRGDDCRRTPANALPLDLGALSQVSLEEISEPVSIPLYRLQLWPPTMRPMRDWLLPFAGTSNLGRSRQSRSTPSLSAGTCGLGPSVLDGHTDAAGRMCAALA